jgi:hypothetical protein
MENSSRLKLVLSGIAVSLLLTGCFSYTQTNKRSSMEDAQASVMENSDNAEDADVAHNEPGVENPRATSSLSALGTDGGLPQRQRMLIYLDPWILGNS